MTAAAPAFIRELESTPGTASAGPWAVRMRGVGKRYRIGSARHLGDSLREDIASFFSRLSSGGKAAPEKEDAQTFWALKDIDLDILRGETIGIIGRNGAGKSTMLKILSRITPPTAGEMRYKGRLASLLEVGTGFHRELTGRENIFLNGSILGMRRTEIDRHFNAIVEFSGIGKFLDTPVKHYSSGMYVRLAFAVAAHLHTDILVVDEVLAVGDIQFQKKCLGKIRDVASDGRTVLFVSHSMSAVKALCSHGVLLKEGRIEMYGPIQKVVTAYAQSEDPGDQFLFEGPTAPDQCRLVRIELETPDGSGHLPHDGPVSVLVTVNNPGGTPPCYVGFSISDTDGTVVCFSRDFEFDTGLLEKRVVGNSTFRVSIPANTFKPGKYFVNCTLGRLSPATPIQPVDRAVSFKVYDNRSIRSQFGFPWNGVTGISPQWARVAGNPDDTSPPPGAGGTSK